MQQCNLLWRESNIYVLLKYKSHWKRLTREPGIRLNSCKLKLHTHVKYSGILIEENLSYNKQIYILCSKLDRDNKILSKVRHFEPLKTCQH